MSLVVHEVRKEYPTATEPLVVLRGVSLEVAGGESVAIVGPSGSGKSTLLNIMGTLDRPTGGSVRFEGVDPFSLKDSALARFRGRRVGFVFQDHHLLPQCTALENVLLARLAVGRVTEEEEARARGLLEEVGLAARERHLPSELSGGECQRVAVARALMNKPGLMLCDEPTGNLDADASAQVGRLLHDAAAKAGAALIVVTHNPELAQTCARRLRMERGVLVGG